MKKNLWERLLPRPHKSHFLTLSAVLAISPLVGIEHSQASSNAIVTTPVVNKDVQWIQLNGSYILDGNTIAIDISNHTHLQMESGMTFSASSKDSSASALIDGNMLKVTVLSAGTATIELKAEKAGRATAMDTLQFNMIRIGDTNGDGNVTSADALYITKIANTTPPLSDPVEINRLDINRDGKVSKEDATALLTNYVGKSGTVASTYIVNIKEINDKPQVSALHVNGQLKLDEVLEIMPEYQDVEGDLADTYAYQWYRGKNQDGSDKAIINGAASKQYTVQAEDVGQYVFVAVTPSAQTGVQFGDNSIWTSSIPVPDTTPPELNQPLQPLSQISKAAMTSNFSMVFNEPIQAGTGNITLHKKADQSIIQTYAANDATKVKIQGEIVEIVNLGLADVTDYYIEVDAAAIQDLAGNHYAGLSGSTGWSFTTPDTTAPLWSATLPANDAQDVLKNSALKITFNEAVKAVAGKKITIYKQDQTKVESISANDSSKVTITGSEVTIQHSNFTEKEHYYAVVEAGAFTDLSDNEFAGITNEISWAFYVPDVTNPEVDSLYPLHNGQNIDVTDDFRITFNETVTAVSGKQIKIYQAITNNEVAAIDADDSSQVTITNNEVVLHNPGLQNDNSYYIEVAAGAFQDIAGNPAVAIGGTTSWHFTTPDTIAPTVTAYSPLLNGIMASKDDAITLAFSEDVKADATKKITIYNTSDDVSVTEFKAADSAHVAIVGKLVTLSKLGLEELGSYYIIIEQGAFIDSTGNSYAGMSGKTEWVFATPDTTAPTISKLSPTNLATHVTLDAPLEITFNEDVKAVSGKNVSILKDSDNSVVASYSATDTSKVSVVGNVVSIDNPGLSDETTYYLKLDTGAFTDLSNNAFAGISSSATWSFSTPDTTSPVVAQLTPNNQANEVSKSADFSVIFNENIQAVAGKMIHIYKTSDHNNAVASYDISDTNHVTINGKTLTIKNPGLDDFTQYEIDIAENALEDMSGNKFTGLVGTTSWSFWSPDTRTFTATNFEDFTENQLFATKGAILDLIITGDTFKNGAIVDEPNTLSVNNFILNHAPSGLTIISADKVDDHEVYLALDYDGTDFDTDITNFSVTIKAEALAAGRTLTSPDATITATVELELVTESISPANGSTNVDKSGDLTMTFDSNVTGVAGKKINIYKKSDDSLIQTIDAGDSSKVTTNNKVATIKHQALLDQSEYYVTVEGGAFKDAQNKQNIAITGKTDWAFKTVVYIPGPFFTDFVDGGNGKIALEMANLPNSAGYGGYQLWVYKYMKNNGTMKIDKIPLFSQVNKDMLYIFIGSIFYDAMDKMNIWYFNDEIDAYNPTSFTVNAYLITDANGRTIDVLGDPSAVTANAFLPNGGTLVRKPAMGGGVSTYLPFQWNEYPKGTYQYFGNHTN
jgi:methionine-rich copper-binding protein CopC